MSNHATKASLAVELKIARHHLRRQQGTIERLNARVRELEAQLAAPAGEQVGLTDEILTALRYITAQTDIHHVRDVARALIDHIAAHEAKRNGGAS